MLVLNDKMRVTLARLIGGLSDAEIAIHTGPVVSSVKALGERLSAQARAQTPRAEIIA